ncbi:HAMP domain-containing histidine kinase [Bacteriovoracaceae bacterium]|nr:HAMP domain-containing histidine kinase [Bacteriovoracaceae bacterium]
MSKLKSTFPWSYLLISLWILSILILGSWWLYLIVKLGRSNPENTDYLDMAIWEGGFFFILLIISSIFVTVIYTRDIKRAKAMHIFFSSLSHELKTPLASIKLQAEAIQEYLKMQQYSKLPKLSQHLVNESYRLENEFEKILQLSRTELRPRKSKGHIQLDSLISIINQYRNESTNIKIESHIKNDEFIQADKISLEIILKNMIENSHKYSPQPININIVIKKYRKNIILTYSDTNLPFSGNTKNLGSLFYQYKSRKGSGIGLYLCRTLLKNMGASFSIFNNPGLVFVITFKGACT